MGISFSSSLFGLAGSLALGFLDLQAGQAQNRFYMELEDWLSTIVSDLSVDGDARPVAAAPSGEMRSAIDKLKEAVAETGSNKAATAAMANLAEAIHGLVSHMRTEQQMIRDWADAQAAQGREMNRLLERIAGEEPRKDELRKTALIARGITWRWHARAAKRGIDYWPGFVDALSTLILGIVFLLSVFVIVQFFLSQEVTGKDTALQRLNAQLAQLTEMLSLEKVGKSNLEDTLASLRANLAASETDRDRLKGLYEGLQSGTGRANELAGQLDNQKSLTSRAMAQVELLNQQIAALRRQLAALESALEASEGKDKDSQARIADLGQRLNLAPAKRVQELSRFRSEFFRCLCAILGDRPDIRVVGDRFVFQSEVFFDLGRPVPRPGGRAELDKLAAR